MTLRTKPIDGTRLKFRYGGCTEHHEWVNGVRSDGQTFDEATKLLMWKVTASVVFADAQQIGAVVITVPAKDNPAETALLDEPIEFGGLMEETWVNNGNSGQRWTAQSINTKPATKSAAAAKGGVNG